MKPSKPIAAVACHFNPCHYTSRLRNYYRFRENLPRDLELLTVECSFDGGFELDGDNILRLRSNSVLWQKERLLQIGAEHLIADGYQNIIALDADVIYPDQIWHHEIHEKLQDCVILQALSRARRHWTFGAKTVPAMIAFGRGTPGVAWAARSEFWLEVGLYQHAIVGSGDRALADAVRCPTFDAMSALVVPHWQANPSEMFRQHYREWAAKACAFMRGRIDFLDREVQTLPHGRGRNRRYVRRHLLTRTFDPYRDVTTQPGEPLEWIRPQGPMQSAIRDYFASRREDQ